jgi:diamine N-acetyltransferase
VETENLKLRVPEPEDAPLIFQWENDPDVWRHGSHHLPFSLQQIKDYINAIKDVFSDKQIRFMIDLKSGPCIGMVDLFDYEPLHQRAAVGVLLDKDYRNNGYAGQAIQLLMTYASEQLGLHQIHCSIRSGNEQSIRLFEKNGFKKIATLPQWLRKGKGWENELIYSRVL